MATCRSTYPITNDEIGHAAFLNAYLESKGEGAGKLKKFHNLPLSKVIGANQNLGRITSLQSLNVDISWYFRYRSTKNSDLSAPSPQLLNNNYQPAIPISDEDTIRTLLCYC